MAFPVSIQKKKRFLTWLQQYYTNHQYELDWFVDELIDHEKLLFRLYFVDQIENCPKGLIITIKRGKAHIQFFKEQIVSEDIYVAYHEMQLYRDEPFYVHVNFVDDMEPDEYLDVIENEQNFDYNIQIESNNLLQYLLTDGKDKFIKEEIDRALEDGNVERLKYLTKLLQIKN